MLTLVIVTDVSEILFQSFRGSNYPVALTHN